MLSIVYRLLLFVSVGALNMTEGSISKIEAERGIVLMRKVKNVTKKCGGM